MAEVASTPYDFAAYQAARVKAEREKAALEAASAHYTNALILQRLAEIKSQSDPIGKIRDADWTEREKMIATAFYVVHGRVPKPEPRLEPPLVCTVREDCPGCQVCA